MYQCTQLFFNFKKIFHLFFLNILHAFVPFFLFWNCSSYFFILGDWEQTVPIQLLGESNSSSASELVAKHTCVFNLAETLKSGEMILTVLYIEDPSNPSICVSTFIILFYCLHLRRFRHILLFPNPNLFYQLIFICLIVRKCPKFANL